MSKTRYILLRQNEDGSWDEFSESTLAPVEATSSRAAIRAVLSDAPLKGDPHAGTFVAIPLRSWQPQPVEVEAQYRLKIG